MRAHLYLDLPLAITGAALATFYGPLPLAGAALLASGLHTWGVLSPRSSLYLPVHWRLPAHCGAVALTFDDGPHPEVTPRLLDLLARSGATATFFVIGEHVRRHPALVARLVAEGHSLGLHSDTHDRRFNCWSSARVRRDLDACAAACADATGQAPPRLFRPPVGLKNPLVGAVAQSLGLTCVTWMVRGRDTGNSNAQRVIARLEPGLVSGGILLLHDGCEPRHPAKRQVCLEVVPVLLQRLAQAGLAARGIVACAAGVTAGPAATGTRRQ